MKSAHRTHGNARLTVEEVRAMRKAHATGKVSIHSLGRRYGISPNHARAIVLRLSWKWL